MRRPDPSLVRLLFFVGALLALGLILVFAGRILLPLLLGLALAYLLNPLVSRLERRGWPRTGRARLGRRAAGSRDDGAPT